MIAGLPAVPAAGSVGGHARVVTGGCSGDCRNTQGDSEMNGAQTPDDPSGTGASVRYAREHFGVVTHTALLCDLL